MEPWYRHLFTAKAETGPDAILEQEFITLANTWRNERGPSSSMTKFLLHPAYQRIIGLGPSALPFILREMRRKPDYWFWALRSMTGEDPVPPEHAGNLPAMTQDWLNWADQKRYLVDNTNRKPLPQAG